MSQLLQNIIGRKLQDFKGTRVKGQVVLSDALVNEVLQLGAIEAKKSLTNDVVKPDQNATSAASNQQPDLTSLLLQNLKLDELHYRTEAGKTIVSLGASLPEQI